jgi:hypothetical protein
MRLLLYGLDIAPPTSTPKAPPKDRDG